MLLKETWHLFIGEIFADWRQKYAVSGALLYVVSTIFVCALAFGRIIDPHAWNALFWVIMLFTAVNAVAKSFIRERSDGQLYLYTLASPQAIILGKMAYNMLLLLILSVFTFAAYGLFIGQIVKDLPVFFTGMILGSIGFSGILTLISAIASKTNNNAALMAILSFPLIIPLIMTLVKLTQHSIDGIERSACMDFILVLALLNLIIMVLSYLLFPYLWRD